MTECAGDLRQIITGSSIEEQKSLIRGFIKETKVTGDKVEITYTMPAPVKETRNAEVLDIERIGSAYRIRTNDLRVMRMKTCIQVLTFTKYRS